MQQCLIWGTGENGKRALECYGDLYEVAAFIDNDATKWGSWGSAKEGIPVCGADELCKYPSNTVIIIASAAYKEICQQVKEMGYYNYLVFHNMDSCYRAYLFGVLFEADIHSFSDWREDVIVASILLALDVPLPRYAEIGVNDPIKSSNTFLFYEKGATGILIDANPDIAEYVQRIRAHDRYISKGISVAAGEKLNFYRSSFSGLSTFLRDKAMEDDASRYKGGRLQDVVQVDVTTFDEVFADEHVQYVSLDVEGMDEAIMRTIDFSKYPEMLVFCSETTDEPGAREYMRTQGFRLFGYTWGNEIFVRETVWERVMTNLECRRIYERLCYLNTKLRVDGHMEKYEEQI